MKKIASFLLKNKVFIFFNILIFIAKIGYSYITGFKGLTFEDWDIANNLVKYRTYAEFINIGPTAFKLPFYPFFLSFFIYNFGDSAKIIIVIVQHFIYFLIPLLFILISKIFNKEKLGIITGYLFIFSPAYFIYSDTIESTNVFIIVFLFFIYRFLLVWISPYSFKNLLFLGVTTAFLCLIQVVIVPIVSVLFLSLFIFKKINLRQTTILTTIVLCLYSPWVIRNYITFDKLIVSKTPVWLNIHFGYMYDVQIFKSLQQITPERNAQIRIMRTYTDEFEMEKMYKKEVQEIERKNPNIAIKKGFANALMLYYVPARYFYDNSISMILGRKIYVIILNIISLYVLLLLCKQKNWMLLLFSLVFFVNFTLPYVIGQAGMTRYKIDFEWYQLFLFAYFIYFKWNVPRLDNGELKR